MAEKSKQSKRGGPRKGAGRPPKQAGSSGEATPEIQPPKPLHPALAANVWQPGQSGNPMGRPKGARNRLGEAFIEDFYADWQQHGKAAIAKVRETRPQDYLKAAVAILPKEVKVVPGDFDEMTNDELDRRIRALAAAISLEIGIGEGAGGSEETPGTEQAGGLRAIQ